MLQRAQYFQNVQQSPKFRLLTNEKKILNKTILKSGINQKYVYTLKVYIRGRVVSSQFYHCTTT